MILPTNICLICQNQMIIDSPISFCPRKSKLSSKEFPNNIEPVTDHLDSHFYFVCWEGKVVQMEIEIGNIMITCYDYRESNITDVSTSFTSIDGNQLGDVILQLNHCLNFSEIQRYIKAINFS